MAGQGGVGGGGGFWLGGGGGGGGGVVEKKKVTRVFVAIAFFYAFLCGGVIMMKVMSPSFLCLKKK